MRKLSETLGWCSSREDSLKSPLTLLVVLSITLPVVTMKLFAVAWVTYSVGDPVSHLWWVITVSAMLTILVGEALYTTLGRLKISRGL